MEAREPFKLNIYVFFVSFAVGLLYIYLSTPHNRVVVKYPTPYNVGKVVYTDSADKSCYIYTSETVECPEDKSKVKPQPVV